MSLLNKIAFKIPIVKAKVYPFLSQNLRKTPQHESGVLGDLQFNVAYGSTPAMRALNNFVGIHKKEALENTVYAAINLTTVAQFMLKVDNTTMFSHFVSANDEGHSYNLTINVPLEPGLAKQLVEDPQALKELMTEFLNGGATFIRGSTAQEFLEQPLWKRVIKYAANIEKIRKENAEIRQDPGFAEDIAAFLGGVDLVFIRNHRSGTYASGIKDQSWVAGTSGRHGMCGQLTWRIIWDPKNPNVLIIQLYGDGQSYSSFVDGGNNDFASLGFPIMAELFQYKMNHNLKGATYDDVQKYIEENNPQLYNRASVFAWLMPQRFGQLLNYIWRRPEQFTADKVRLQLQNSPSKALVYSFDVDQFSKILTDSTPASKVLAQKSYTEEILAEGAYFENEKYESGVLQAMYTPEEMILDKGKGN